MAGPVSEGEMRHEQCRYGIFATEAYQVRPGGREVPFAMPLCGWTPPTDAPPMMARVWSGAIDFERDCAVCKCFAPVGPA